MRLLELPSIVIGKIAELLDRASITAMSTAHPQLQEKLEHAMEYLKLKEITESILEYLDVNGPYVRHLDLSGCGSSHEMIKSVILKCQSIRELNLVNSNCRNVNALANSNGVETLSLTALDGVYYILPSNYQLMKKHTGFLMCCSEPPYVVRRGLPRETIRGRYYRFYIFPPKEAPQPQCFESLASSSLRSVKKIYIETLHGEQQMVFTMCLLNLCHNVEVIHINIYGKLRTEPEEGIHLPELAAHHWETVHTVVVTRHQSKRGSAKGVMRAIFAHHTAPEIRQWVDRDQECYIYEYGQFNGEPRSKFETNSDITLLRRFHQVDLSMDGDGAIIFASPWGPARSVRITGNLLGASSYLEHSLCSTLTELDITKCHGDFTNKFRVHLLTAVPALEVLASSLCAFALLDSTAQRESGSQAAYKQFKTVLHGLRLKKVYIRGYLHGIETCVPGRCFCPNGLHCSRCRRKEPLRSSELVDLSGLDHLVELTVRDLDLETSSFNNLGNSTLHTLKLCLKSNISGVGLENLIQKSRNLKYLKLEAPELDLKRLGLWKPLSEARNLRQLCLRTGMIDDDNFIVPQGSIECFKSIIRNLEFMHLHCYFRLFDDIGYYAPKSKIRHFNPCPYDVWSLQCPGIIGRGLCFAESFVGLVPPIGWEID